MSTLRPGNQVTTTMYHLTDQFTLDKILENKQQVLEARSNPFWSNQYDKEERKTELEQHGVDFKKLKEKFPSKKFIVGLIEPQGKNWKESGLLPYLLEHISDDETIISIEANVPTNRIMIRDHHFVSPQRSIELHGEDILGIQNKTTEDKEKLIRMTADYFKSSQTYEEYLQNPEQCKTPEVWYAGDFIIPKTNSIKTLTKNQF